MSPGRHVIVLEGSHLNNGSDLAATTMMAVGRRGVLGGHVCIGERGRLSEEQQTLRRPGACEEVVAEST